MGWDIRFYPEENYNVTIDHVGNFQNFGNRQKDDVMVFEGMFGLDSYLIWYIHRNMTLYDFSTVNLNLSLFSEVSPSKLFYENSYKVIDVKYDSSRNRYVLVGKSLDSILLDATLAEMEYKSLKWSENRTGIDLLREIVPFKVVHYPNEKEGDPILYMQVAFKPSDKIRDIIDYVATDNGYEWYVKHETLHIGREVFAFEEYNSTFINTSETENESESVLWKKIQGDSRPMQLMSHTGKTWRCVWCKHLAGKSGGISKGCFSKIGRGGLDKRTYFDTLEGKIEIANSHELNSNDLKSYIRLGSIIKDEGEIYIDQVSTQINLDSEHMREPHSTKMDNSIGGVLEEILYQKERVSRMSQYVDDGAGLFFPSPKLEAKAPNSILAFIEGRDESAVHLGYLMGNGEDLFSLPMKNKGDLRLTLPNGWTLYVKEDGDTYLQVDGTPSTIPIEDITNPFVHIKPDGTIKINSSSSTSIEIDSLGNITIDGLTTKVQGGGNKLSHTDHTHGFDHIHTTGNMGMPVPGMPTVTKIPGILIQTDAHLPTQGTIRTEAD